MSEQTEKVELEENIDSIVVVDPDDYQKTKKLQSIQEAKDRYREFTLNRSERFRELDETWANPKEAMEKEEAQSLAMYGSELLPLIEEGIEKGAISEADLKLETDKMVEALLDKPTMDIREMIRLEGCIVADGEYQHLPRHFQKRMYRQLERIEQKLGLGLELEENKEPAQI
jgi:hypothetical protein